MKNNWPTVLEGGTYCWPAGVHPPPSVDVGRNIQHSWATALFLGQTCRKCIIFIILTIKLWLNFCRKHTRQKWTVPYTRVLCNFCARCTQRWGFQPWAPGAQIKHQLSAMQRSDSGAEELAVFHALRCLSLGSQRSPQEDSSLEEK